MLKSRQQLRITPQNIYLRYRRAIRNNPTNGVLGVDLLAPAMGNLAAGQTRKFLAEINLPNADVQGVTWSSNNPAVATVDSTGLVTIIGPGTVTITVDTNDGHYTDSVTFTVPGGGGGGGTTNVPVVRVDLTQTNASIQEGQDWLALFYNLYPSNATNKKIVWTNSSPDISSPCSAKMLVWEAFWLRESMPVNLDHRHHSGWSEKRQVASSLLAPAAPSPSHP